MKSRWFVKIAALVCAFCLAMGVMSQTVFARDDSDYQQAYTAEEPEATFVVLDGETSPTPEATDNRLTLPVYLDGAPAGECAMINGEPYMGVADFFELLGVDAQIIDNGNAVSLATDGVMLLAQVGQAYFTCNERYLYLDNGAQVLNGSVALPMEELVKCMGVTAYWDRVQWSLTMADTHVKPLMSGSEYYDEADVYWLSRLIFAMAAEEPLEAKVAVGGVCVNRVGNERFSGQNNIYEVVFAKNQFSVASNGMIYVQPDDSSILAAKLALDGCDPSGGAAYVARSDMGAGYERVAQMGNLQFFTAA